MKKIKILSLLLASTLITNSAFAELSNDEINKMLNNPLASLISIPFQLNYSIGGGERDKDQNYTLNIQPIIPINLNADWNIISRTIFPLIEQQSNNLDGQKDTTKGIGDTTQTFFVSPTKSKYFIWGVGGAFLLPTASEDRLGTEKWGAGPSAILIKQSDKWTFGVIANHIWSFAGNENRDNVNTTFIQPIIVRQLPGAYSLGFNTEYQYDWEHRVDSLPLNFTAGKVVRFGKLPVNFTLGFRYFVDSRDDEPDYGFRFVTTFVLPE